ncbi:MAG TPA: Do family serine endopeptidase [Thermoanaerobaculia bacterium]|nr:Do family serine endopeptidase [Thermoanaerobaculia bacterium]
MNTPRTHHVATTLLVVGAVIFGMVLAGGLQLTVPGMTAPQTSTLSATQLVANSGAAATSARGLPSFADLAEAVDPAVVSIQAATIEKASPQKRGRRGLGSPGQGQGQGQGQQDPFEFFFGPRGRGGDDDNNNGERRSDAGGSGFVISSDGLVVTNYHVVEGATTVKVHLDNRDYTATVKGADQATDIALLKIDAGRPLRYLELGDSDHLRVGDWIMVVGNPLNLDKTVTTGVVSAKGRSIGISDVSFENFIQTDAAINFGNSGGPLINLDGQVVGIATAINYGAENIGFAVPVNTLRGILPQLRERGKVSRGYLGIQITNLDYPTAQAFGLPNTDGALVGSVDADTPAGKAGIEHGDIIVQVDGRKVGNTRDLINYVSDKGPNASVILSVLRNGQKLDRNVKLGERPTAAAQAEETRPDRESGIDWLGLQYDDLTSEMRQGHGIPSSLTGIVVTNVAPTSPLYDARLRPGDIITEVNGQPVKSVGDFEKVVKGAKSGSFLRLYVERPAQGQGGGPRPQPFWAVVKVP